MLEHIFLKLLENSIQASFFVLAILFLRLCFKHMPKRYVCILWALLALKLLLPVQITSELSLVPDTGRVQTWAEVEVSFPQKTAPLQDNSSMENLYPSENILPIENDLPAKEIDAVTNLNPLVPDTSQQAVDVPSADFQMIDMPDTDTPAQTGLPLFYLFSILWCVGMIALLGYGIISYLRTKLQLREAVHDKENIWYSDAIPSPFVLGYVKPRIYIPFSVEPELLPYIIAHEKSHLARFDHLSKLVGYLLLCVYWFNPFMWGAYITFCKDLELACDERVILKLGDSERKSYSQALLACSITNKALLESPLAFSEAAIKERIANILNNKKPGFWGLLLAAITCIIAIVCFLTSPKTETDEIVTPSHLEETDIQTQLDAFPGQCSVDEEGNLVMTLRLNDYECAIATSSITGETVYHWSTRTPTKTYPLEIQNGNVQEVPAKVITEEELLTYAFGESVIQMTYKAHPYGTKQYILRQNGTIHVNIANEDTQFINLQYLTFEVADDEKTATLTENGKGYYLLQANDVSALNAFREAFTGEGHFLPSDTTQLPWEWLLTMNGEEYSIPKLNSSDIPAINHVYDYEMLTHYNIYDFYNGFVVAEIRKDGMDYKEFRYQDETDDIIILIDDWDEIISFTYNGQEKTLPNENFSFYYGTGGSYSVPYYVDVTGDGKKEFMICSGGGGTGYWENHCSIFNPDTMEQIPIDSSILDITSNLHVTLTEFIPEEGKLHYKLEYGNQTGESDISFRQEYVVNIPMLEPGVTLEDANQHFCYIPDEETHNISYNPERECFEMETWLWINNTVPGFYIGELRADYIWNADAQKFILDLNSVELEAY